MLQNVQDTESKDFSGGLSTISDIFKMEKNQSPNLMNIKVNFDGSIEKRLGTTTQNSIVLSGSGVSGFTGSISNAITNGMIAYFKLDEISGSRQDSYGSHLLQDLNTVGFTDGRVGNAARFVASQSESLLQNNTSSLQVGSTSITWAGWVYVASSGERTIFAKRDYDEKTVLLMHDSGVNASTALLDSSFNNFPITANSGAKLDTTFARYGSSSLYIQGSSGFASISNNGIFNLGGSDNRWTWEIYTRFGFIDTTTRSGFISQQLDTANRIGVMWNGSANQLWFQIISGNTTQLDYRPSWSPVTGTFYEVTLVRDGTAIQAWVNGTTLGTSTSITATFVSIGSDLEIGRAMNSSGLYQTHSGWLDETRFTQGRARYVTTANFTAHDQEFLTQNSRKLP